MQGFVFEMQSGMNERMNEWMNEWMWSSHFFFNTAYDQSSKKDLKNSGLNWGRYAGWTCKRLLYHELADGSRPIGRPKLRFKDNCKSILKTGNILHNWNDTVKDRVKWRSMIKTVSDKLNISRKGKYERARERRKR